MFILGWEDFPNIHKHSQGHTCVHRGCVIVFKTTLKNTSPLPHHIPGNELQPSVFARTTSGMPPPSPLPSSTFTVKRLLRFSSSQRCVCAPSSTFTVQTHPGSLRSLSRFMWFFQKKETFPGSCRRHRRRAITPSFILLTQSCKPGYVMTPACYVSGHFGPFFFYGRHSRPRASPSLSVTAHRSPTVTLLWNGSGCHPPDRTSLLNVSLSDTHTHVTPATESRRSRVHEPQLSQPRC